MRVRGREVALTATEFKLLGELIRRPGQVFTRQVLLERVWDYPYLGDSRLVDVAVQRLRAKVEEDPANPSLIRTVRGAGYKLAEARGDVRPKASTRARAAAGEIVFERAAAPGRDHLLILGGRVPGSTAELYVVHSEDGVCMTASRRCGRVEVYESSPSDGSPLHVVGIPVQLTGCSS